MGSCKKSFQLNIGKSFSKFVKRNLPLWNPGWTPQKVCSCNFCCVNGLFDVRDFSTKTTPQLLQERKRNTRVFGSIPRHYRFSVYIEADQLYIIHQICLSILLIKHSTLIINKAMDKPFGVNQMHTALCEIHLKLSQKWSEPLNLVRMYFYGALKKISSVGYR